MIRKLKWMPACRRSARRRKRDAGVGPERGSEVRGDVRADREERHVAEVEQPGEAHDDVQAQRHDHVGRRQDHVVQRAAARAEEERQDGGEAEARGGGARSRSSVAAAPVVRAVLRPVAADRHGAPCRRAVLRAVEERVLALAAALHARPVAGELRLVEDAEERRHGAVDAAAAGSSAVRPASSTATPSRDVPAAARMTPRRRVRSPPPVGDHERPDRLAELAQSGRVGVGDPVARRHEPLLPQPRPCLLRGPDPIPVGREVVVVGVDEALQQLEPPGRLGPPSGLDLLADPSLVVLVHSDQHKANAGLRSATRPGPPRTTACRRS